MHPSNQNNATNPEPSGPSSSLSRSLSGSLHPRCSLLTNGYSAHAKHADQNMRDMVLNPEAIKHDLRGLNHWITQLAPNTKPSFELYCDRKKYRPADETRIRTVMQTPRKLPTFIYLAGHTETDISVTGPSNGQLAYAPDDCLEASDSDQLKLIAYETMRQWLLNSSHSESLLFLTEVCYCENFLQLPYVLELNGDETQWTKTSYYGSFKGNSSDIVHFAATSPGEQAMSFGTIGSVFTKAFCYVDPKEVRSLKAIAQQLQKNVNEILSGSSRQKSQNVKIYSSRMIDDPHFFATLGFFLSSSGVEDDYDSSG
ncbi:hypothetical protein V565_075650 [Rhizoctonia solani 123E]|uniref:Peptidase C14 caspase domain-containing protein n=1 Tax=Rhizoctonia solani 123E TaxID=1423351 RepID=A0A074RU85_9AGAM|nr:hypothetical protein V565_075650 [Rhizoctonia solani 123E]